MCVRGPQQELNMWEGPYKYLWVGSPKKLCWVGGSAEKICVGVWGPGPEMEEP